LQFNKDRQIVADSTFYICFLEDIHKPEVLTSVLDSFDLLITPLVQAEISKSSNFTKIQAHPKLIYYARENLGEALRPFFSKKQIQKGETEVIELAYDFYVNGEPKVFILDDKQPRSFVHKNLPYLEEFMIGTVGFVGDCYCEYGIFEKVNAMAIVILISKSSFRVSADVIREVLARIDSR
jgi:predicted nucleic acid-binding protein